MNIIDKFGEQLALDAGAYYGNQFTYSTDKEIKYVILTFNGGTYERNDDDYTLGRKVQLIFTPDKNFTAERTYITGMATENTLQQEGFYSVYLSSGSKITSHSILLKFGIYVPGTYTSFEPYLNYEIYYKE